MIYLLMDDFFGSERLAELKRSFTPPDLLDLNTTVLDGQKLTLRELAEACEAVPFLAPRRLVIVHRLATRFEIKRPEAEADRDDSGRDSARKAEMQQFCRYMASVPETTVLALVEPSPVQATNPLLKAVEEARGEVVGPRALRDAELEEWIIDRVRRRGGRISSSAAAQLAAFVGPKLRALDGELEKLIVHAGGQVITESDVASLVSAAREASVFAMVDALGLRNTKVALRLLHELLNEGEPPIRLLAMIIRQFRLLLQISEMQSHGCARQEIAAELRLRSFVVPRMFNQVEKFSLQQLEAIYHRLLEADLSIKTGRADPITALDLLTVELTRVR